MYAAVVSSAVVAGLIAVGAAMPDTESPTPTPNSVTSVACAQATTYPAADAAGGRSCEDSSSAYRGLLSGR